VTIGTSSNLSKRVFINKMLSQANTFAKTMNGKNVGNALTINKAMWQAGLRPWQEYNGDLEAFRRDFRNYIDTI
jgi:hypothetical protein